LFTTAKTRRSCEYVAHCFEFQRRRGRNTWAGYFRKRRRSRRQTHVQLSRLLVTFIRCVSFLITKADPEVMKKSKDGNEPKCFIFASEPAEIAQAIESL
jgi:hypothetical protein